LQLFTNQKEKMKRLMASLLLGLIVLTVQGQMVDPVHFSTQLNMLKGDEGEIVFSATIDEGWHVYSTDLGNGGPISATFNAVKMEGVETVGKLKPRGHVIKQYDKLFDMEVLFFEKTAQFVQRVRFTQPKYTIDCYLEYGACNDEMCMPPTEVVFKASSNLPLKGEAIEAAEKGKQPDPLVKKEETKEVTADTVALIEIPTEDTTAVDSAIVDSATVTPLRLEGMGETFSLWYILLMGFVGGLLAVLMPCIWPIIPMTVSFFLKRAKTDRRKGIRDALTYGVSIIVIYLGLGLLVTALFGSDALNAMSTNAVFNVALFLLLVVFALSFFGWFEIRLPEGWANAVDTKASATTGLISIFLMAFTLVLVSFSCTAPIIGLLLVETATSGNWLAPALGMLGFAVALALPFTLFALFPSWLKQTPKSGAWMNMLKVTLGFIELAFSLKFLSVADLAYGWHILDREVFLSLWIVIFALLGAYLCGWLKFQSDEADGSVQRSMPVVCIMGGLVSLAFAVYMLPGLWGAPCKAVSAFAPPMNTQDFNLNSKVVEARFTDYEQGLAAARAEGKPVLIDFTGFGCVNCRKMEAAVWTDPRVADLLTKDYILVSLFVDDKTPLAEPVEVTDERGTHTLRTVGAKWSYLQSRRFHANAQPFYVAVDGNGQPLTGSRAYDEDVEAYLNFLRQGLAAFASR
jgi:thiol:disulfide interchange protein DsbD